MKESNKDVIDLTDIYKQLKMKKKVFFIVLPITFVIACLYILPEPRTYKCDVTLAPEMTSEDLTGGLASVANQFGFNLGGGNTDAIYPLLYPNVMESNEFLIGLLDAHVKSKDGSINTDYYTYLTKKQKKNVVTQPFKKAIGAIGKLFSHDSEEHASSKKASNPKDINAFNMSKKDYDLVQSLKQKISCTVDKQDNIITITVQDQDPLICATIADLARLHLQDFITRYRTNKARIDVEHYKKLTADAKKQYDKSVAVYSSYCDANQDVNLQSFISKRDEMENEMQLKFNTYSAMRSQLEAMLAKLQEKTPAFTTLQNASMPVKPSGPKRMIFILGMCFVATFVTAFWLVRKSLFSTSKKESQTEEIGNQTKEIETPTEEK